MPLSGSWPAERCRSPVSEAWSLFFAAVVFLPSIDGLEAAVKCLPVLFCRQNTTIRSRPGQFLPDLMASEVYSRFTENISYLSDFKTIVVFFRALSGPGKVIFVAATQHLGVALLFF